MAEQAPETEPEFTEAGYARQVLQLRDIILGVDDETLKAALEERVLAMQAMLAPVILEYFTAHPEARSPGFMNDLVHGPLSWTGPDSDESPS